jgi:hypothetical protein
MPQGVEHLQPGQNEARETEVFFAVLDPCRIAFRGQMLDTREARCTMMSRTSGADRDETSKDTRGRDDARADRL